MTRVILPRSHETGRGFAVSSVCSLQRASVPPPSFRSRPLAMLLPAGRRKNWANNSGARTTQAQVTAATAVAERVTAATAVAILMVRSEIKSLSDLAGRNIAIDDKPPLAAMSL